MVTDFLDDEANASGDDVLMDHDAYSSSDDDDIEVLDDSETDGTANVSHMELDALRSNDDADSTVEFARQTERRLNTIMEDVGNPPAAVPMAPVVAPPRPILPAKVVTAMFKPVGPQIVFMPNKPSLNTTAGAVSALTLAFPVWMGAYSHGSLAEVEMAQAVQYVLNAATTVQQKDGARVRTTLWCIGKSTSRRGMSYKEALSCSANPGKYVAEVFCQDLEAVKKLSDCINDFKTHLRHGDTKENGASFITRLKKKIEMHVSRDRFLLIEPRMLADGMQLARALVSTAQKIGTANAAGSSMPSWMRNASLQDVLSLHTVEEHREENGEATNQEVISNNWLTMFDRNRVIRAVADDETFDIVEQAVTDGLWRPQNMPAYDMNNTNANNVFLYSDAPGTPSFELTKMMMSEGQKAGFQEVVIQHSQSNTTLHQIMKNTFESKSMAWRDRLHVITMWAASHHPQLWPWEHNQRYWMEKRVCDPEFNWDDRILALPDPKALTLGSIWPMGNWQMHSVGELGAKSYVAREKLNAASFSAFLMDPDINNPVPGFMDCGEAGKGKSYKLKLVEKMLFPGQVRTVHRASACSGDEDVGSVIEVYHEAAPQSMNKSNGKNDNDQARANFKASLTERRFQIKTKDAKTRSVFTEEYINLGVPFMCMNESQDKIEPAVLDRFLRVTSGFENSGKYARSASKLTAQAQTTQSIERADAFCECIKIRMAMFNFFNADETFNQSKQDNDLIAWILTKWEDAMPSIAGAASASPRWTNHVGTYARVFTLQSIVTFVQLKLVVPPAGLIDMLEGALDPDDTSSNQYLAFQDLKALEDIDGCYLDYLGTPGCKLVTEAINVGMCDAIMYGFATLVDGSISRRDKETIEGIKEAIYNCGQEPNNADYINAPFGLDSLVGNIVTVLNNRKIKREKNTILGAIHELQNRLVGKDEKTKTQAMITHNHSQILVHRCFVGERLTEKEKVMLNRLKGKTYCGNPGLHPDIDEALSGGQQYRRVDWQQWNNDTENVIMAIPPKSFCSINPDHYIVRRLNNNGSGDEALYEGCIYISEKLFLMASDEEINAADMTVGFSRLLKMFNTPDEWGKICVPAHPNHDTVEFALVDKHTDYTSWQMPTKMRKMANAKYVPEKRKRLLPGIVRKTIEKQLNSPFAEIGPEEDYQSAIAKRHLMGSTLGQELMDGPGDGNEMLDAIFENWLSPLAIQRALNSKTQGMQVD